MDILQIMWISVVSMVLIIGLLFLFVTKKDLTKWINKERYDKDVWGWIITYISIAIIILLFFGFIHYSIYQDAHTLPYEWKAKQNAINDIEQYLIRYDNITPSNLGSIGQGLEANQLKKELANKRSQLEKVETKMLQWINNPMSAYKTTMIQKMTSAGYYD